MPRWTIRRVRHQIRGMRRPIPLLVLPLVAVLLMLCGPAHAACQVSVAAQVPLRLVAGVPVVDVEVNGTALPFVLDTGAERTMVTDSGIARAGIRRDQWASTWVRGISGYERHPNADPASISLGGVALRRHTLAHDDTLAVGPLPQGAMTQDGLVGLLGIDFLGSFDLDLDVPHLRLTLYRVSGCGGRFLPWQGAYQAIPAAQPIRDVLTLPVVLDGTPLRAEIDTGSSVILLTAPGIAKMGLTPPLMAQDTAGTVNGVGRFAVPMRRHPFRALRIGDETVVTPPVWVAEAHVLPIVDLLLGAPWLRQNRVWFSFATNQVFVRAGS